MNKWLKELLYVLGETTLFFIFCIIANSLCNWMCGTHIPLAETMGIMVASSLYAHEYRQDHKDDYKD